MTDRAPNKPRSFEPDELRIMSEAFESALGEVRDTGRGSSALGARDLRRRVASGIIEAAGRGAAEPRALKEAGLAALRTRASDGPAG